MDKWHLKSMDTDAKRAKGHHEKRKYQGILIILAVIMLVGSLCLPSFANEIDQAKDVKTDLEKKKKETEARLSELEKEKNDIIKYIEKLDKEIERINDEIDSLNKDIAKTEDALEKARVELEAAKAAVESQYTVMKKRIQYMYENGTTDYIEILMKSESISDLLNQVEYMSKITEFDNSLLDKYKKLKEDVAVKEKSLEDKVEQLNALKDELTFEQETVEQLAADKNKELAKYEADIEKQQEVSAEITSELAKQEELIESLLEAERKRIEEEERRRKEEERRRKEEEERRRQQEAAANAGSNADTNSSDTTSQGNETSNGVSATGFIWPVPSSSRITSKFGGREQPTAGASTYHKGIDIGASVGTEIVAAASGSVVTAAYSASAGNYIMIYHGDGVYTVYMHCSKLLVSVGEEVNQGQKIALVGNTGVSTGPHLHFGVSVNGTYVNPLNYVGY